MWNSFLRETSVLDEVCSFMKDKLPDLKSVGRHIHKFASQPHLDRCLMKSLGTVASQVTPKSDRRWGDTVPPHSSCEEKVRLCIDSGLSTSSGQGSTGSMGLSGVCGQRQRGIHLGVAGSVSVKVAGLGLGLLVCWGWGLVQTALGVRRQ